MDFVLPLHFTASFFNPKTQIKNEEEKGARKGSEMKEKGKVIEE